LFLIMIFLQPCSPFFPVGGVKGFFLAHRSVT
jgi:hypothetical protein